MTAPPSDHAIPRDAISGARVLVGDMLTWSDLDSLEAPLAAREVVVAVIASARPSRVLLAGPRAGLLIDAVPTDIPVDILVRSLDDARTLGDRAGLHEAAELYCGGLDAFEPGHAYGLVVALGGAPRLLGPDSEGLSEADYVACLSALLEDSGHIVLDLANQLGLSDLVSAVPDEALESDAGWYVGARGFSTRSLFARERAGVLAGAGLQTAATFAALPSIDHHRLLVDIDAVTEQSVAPFGLRDQVGVLAGRAMDEHVTTTPMLREPRTVLQDVVDAGLLDELAPAWLMVATKGASAGHPLALPAIVAAEPVSTSRWSTVAVVSAGGQATLSWASPRHDTETSEGAVSRSLVPPAGGRSLELELRQACATRRHAAVRSRVRRYAAWLGDSTVWTPSAAPRRYFATPANTLVVGEQLQLADASWHRTGAVSAQDALVRGLRHFARRLLSSGSAHPWRVTVTPDELTVTLASMAGLTVTSEMLARAARLEAEVASVVSGHPEALDELLARNIAQGQYARDLPAPDEIGFRELLTHHRVISRELREKQGQVQWLEGTLRHRDRYIRQLERTIERFEETLTYRAVEAIRAPRRIATDKAVSAAMTTARDALPPGALDKARKLASRVLK